MKKALIAIIVLAALMLCLLVGCEERSSALTQEQARQIALEELGITAEQANTHAHMTEYDGRPCYSFHIYVGEEAYEVVIDGVTGEVLHVGEASH